MRKRQFGRAAERLAAGKTVADLCARLGVAFQTTRDSDRWLTVHGYVGNYGVMVSFYPSDDGLLAHWFTRGPVDTKYPTDFTGIGSSYGGACDLNTYHYGKATLFADTLENLCAGIEKGVAMLRERGLAS